MNPFSGRDDLPPGTLEESRRERNRQEDDDRDFYDALWDHAHRYEEENRRDYD